MTKFNADARFGHRAQVHAEPGSGMAITALVFSILSWICLPLISIPAVILGIIVLVRASKTPPQAGGQTMAIVAIVLGALGTLAWVILVPLMLGTFSPAFSQAKQASMQIQSSTNIRSIVQGLSIQSDSNGGRFPATADDWQQNLIDGMYADAEYFVSPYTDGIGDDYFLVPGGKSNFDSTRILVYEDPILDPNYTLIAYADTQVELVEQAEALRLLNALKLPDGTPWTPHLIENPELMP